MEHKDNNTDTANSHRDSLTLWHEGVFLSSSYAGGGAFGPPLKTNFRSEFSTKFGMYIGLCMNFKFQF